MGNNPETNGDICSQEYSGIIFLILKKKKKNPCEKKKARKNYFDKQEKPWEYLKMFREKTKMSYVILFLWAHLSNFRPFKT